MRGVKVACFLVVLFFLSSGSSLTFAQSSPSAGQTAGGIAQQQKILDQQKKLEGRIQSERPTEGQAVSEAVEMPDNGPKAMIHTINVEGSTILTSAEIRKVVGDYEGRELSLKDAQKVADMISDIYRTKGYLTSRAYLPPQSLKEGVLLIKVIEGKPGEVEIRGNKYFSTALLKSRLDMQTGGYFDYSALQRSLVYINESPDRSARATLVPGKQPGTTDVVLDVKDRMPFHAGFEYDNFGSRYMNKSRYSGTLEHNNLTGHDDKLYLKYQTAEANYLRLEQGRYSIPLSTKLTVGGYALHDETELGKEFEDLKARGKAYIYGLFLTESLVQKTDLAINFNAGFDSKSIVNFLSENMTSRDELRIFKAGFDFDISDKWGRNILTTEVDQGFGETDLLGGMSAKDPKASRAGSGGQFTKELVNYYRLQPLFWETSLLWKNSAQYTNNILTASEQFQIGGAGSVRGYGPAEFSGDRGYYTSAEWSLPFYGLSRNAKVPFRNEKLYDSLRFVTFWDIAGVSVLKPATNEQKNEVLQGYGFGIRFNVKDLTARVEVGYPFQGDKPADGHNAHTWLEFTYKF
jgi:hemolysin activation/secretion protein